MAWFFWPSSSTAMLRDHLGVSWNRGTPSYHPFRDWIFHSKLLNQPVIGGSPFMEIPRSGPPSEDLHLGQFPLHRLQLGLQLLSFYQHLLFQTTKGNNKMFVSGVLTYHWLCNIGGILGICLGTFGDIWGKLDTRCCKKQPLSANLWEWLMILGLLVGCCWYSLHVSMIS